MEAKIKQSEHLQDETEEQTPPEVTGVPRKRYIMAETLQSRLKNQGNF